MTDTADNYFKVVAEGRIVGVESFCSDDLRAGERAYERAERAAQAAGGEVVVLRVPEEFAGAPPFADVRSVSACPPGACLWERDQAPRTGDDRRRKSRFGWTCTRCNRHKAARAADDEGL